MKKISMMILTIVMMTVGMFACESIFDKIDGITCELQYILCKDNNIDIKVCDKVSEKVESYEEAEKKYNDVSKAVAQLQTKMKKEKNESKLLDMSIEYQDLLYELSRLDPLDNFLGEESLKLIESEEFCNEVWNVLEDHIDYNYLMD